MIFNDSDQDDDELEIPGVIDGYAVQIPGHTNSYIKLDQIMGQVNYSLAK